MGILQKIVNKYKEAKKTYDNLQEFKKALLEAVSDGKLTNEEIYEVSKKREELGLKEDDIKLFIFQAYRTAFASAKSDEKITAEEEQELLNIQKYLGIDDGEVQSQKKELTRLRLLYEIQQGNIPPIQVINLVMQKGEKAYWSEPAVLVEEKVVSRHYEGGSSGGKLSCCKRS